MRLLLRRVGVAVILGFLIVYSSCEKHHVGEVPPNRAPAPAGQIARQNVNGPTAPSAAVSATPAEFFPSSTPR